MIHIFGGGTIQHIRSHLALCAPAYGSTAQYLHNKLHDESVLHLTKMADHTSKLETNEDVFDKLKLIVEDKDTTAIVFNVALCDFSGKIGDVESSKYTQRLSSRDSRLLHIQLEPTTKILPYIKKHRPDIKVAGFKTTSGQDTEAQISLAIRQIEETNVDIVLANDILTRNNILIGNNLNVIQGEREYLLDMLLEEINNA